MWPPKNVLRLFLELNALDRPKEHQVSQVSQVDTWRPGQQRSNTEHTRRTRQSQAHRSDRREHEQGITLDFSKPRPLRAIYERSNKSNRAYLPDFRPIENSNTIKNTLNIRRLHSRYTHFVYTYSNCVYDLLQVEQDEPTRILHTHQERTANSLYHLHTAITTRPGTPGKPGEPSPNSSGEQITRFVSSISEIRHIIRITIYNLKTYYVRPSGEIKI